MQSIPSHNGIPSKFLEKFRLLEISLMMNPQFSRLSAVIFQFHAQEIKLANFHKTSSNYLNNYLIETKQS